MIKNKHNKKRNTIFLYEILVRTITKSVVNENKKDKEIALKLLKEHFNFKSPLYKELQLYKQILSNEKMEKETAEKFLNEVKKVYASFGFEELSKEKTNLNNEINDSFDDPKQIYTTFVPHYKNMATIYQMFTSKDFKRKVILEQKLIEMMIQGEEEKETLKPIDNLTYKTYVNKFNDKYENDLLNEQKELLNKYILSFTDNGLDFKIFLNEEIGRLKESIKQLLEDKEIKEDNEIKMKVEEVLKSVEGYKEKEILNESTLEQILKVQQLVGELNENKNKD